MRLGSAVPGSERVVEGDSSNRGKEQEGVLQGNGISSSNNKRQVAETFRKGGTKSFAAVML